MNEKMSYPPQPKPTPVVKPGEFVFATAALDHGHIYGMTRALVDAGGTVGYVYDSNPERVKVFVDRFPTAKPVDRLEDILENKDIHMVASAGITNERAALGMKVMDSGKDYFVDKAPFTTMEQLDMAKKKAVETGKRYMVYYAERLHDEGALYAGQIIDAGAIGRVISVIGTGPHRLNPKGRPDWFFIKKNYGGILCDIGSHQIEQFLSYTGAKDARVVRSQVGNFDHPEYPELEDYGDAMLVADNGASHYFRVDWFTAKGLSAWGDSRVLVLGTKGSIEVRKNTNVGIENKGANVILVNGETEEFVNVSGQVGCPFFGQLILDSLNRTENAMTQAHAFKAAELSVQAEIQAEVIYDVNRKA